MALDSLDPLTAPMPAPPVRQFSFTDFQTNNPTAPPPGDRLDAEFDRANNAIEGTIAWANVSLNTDGTLRDAIVGESNLQPDLFDDIASDAIAQVQPLVDQAAAYSASAGSSSVSASSSATSAASQAVIAQGAAGRANNAQVAAEAARDASQGYADDALSASVDATNAENDATGAAALAQDYAVVTQAWAEHMPDPIPPNILAVMGITGDHWSSRWWANQAAAAFGALTSLYLGAFPQPPTQTPTGGAIPIGAIYYNTTSGQPYVWTGTGWVPFYAPTKAVTLSLAYSASGSQTTFPLTTVDLAGNSYTMNATTPEPLEVWVNGVRLLLNQPAGIGDWNVNATNSTVTLTAAPRAGSIIQVDVLTPASQLAPSQVVTKGLAPFTPIDGTTATFPLKLGDNTPITALTAAELFISVDGTVQQPGIDFSTAGGFVTFTEAPLLGSKVWSYWYGQGSGDAASGGGAAGLYLPLTGGVMSGPLNYVATGSTTSRSAQDRAADWVNVKDFGAKLDGVTDDSPAFNAARNAAVRGQTIYVPEGKLPSIGITWSSPDMTKQVKWWLDGGVTFPLGGAVLTMGPQYSGDITQGTLLNPNGSINFLGKRTNPTLATDLYRMDYILDSPGGLGQIGSALTMNGVANDTNDSALWLMNIIADSNSVNPAASGMVALSVTARKNSVANIMGIHVTSLDSTGQNSGTNGGRGFVAIETANRANGLDDASNGAMWGGVGNRINMHVSSTLQQTNTNETNFSYSVWASSDAAAPNLYIKSIFGVGMNTQTYQVFDARGSIPPYVSTNPVIALNMAAGMVVDFNGGPALSSAPRNYLRYETATSKLFYYVAGVAKWSVDAGGNMRCAGTVTGSVTP